jgi:hypothetical protein
MIDARSTPIVAEKKYISIAPRKLTAPTPCLLGSHHDRREVNEVIVTKAHFSRGNTAENRIRFPRDYSICVYFDDFAAWLALGLEKDYRNDRLPLGISPAPRSEMAPQSCFFVADRARRDPAKTQRPMPPLLQLGRSAVRVCAPAGRQHRAPLEMQDLRI